MGIYYPSTDTYVSDYAIATNSPIYQYNKAKRQYEARQQRQTTQNMNASSESLSNAIKAQADAATKAAQIQANAANQSLQWQKDQYEDAKGIITDSVAQAREDVNPWRVAGEDALGQLVEKIQTGPGEYTQSPGYQVRLDEGIRSINRSAAAKGGALSGQNANAVVKFGQDYATQDYDNFLRRYYESLTPLQNLSGLGANAAQQQGNYSVGGATALTGAGQNAVSNMTNTNLYSGEATAGGLMNSANILTAYQQALNEQNTAYNAWKSGSNF